MESPQRKLSIKRLTLLIAVLKKTLESPLDCKEIKPVHPKGNQSWIFIGRTDAEVEVPIFQPPDTKSWLIGKDPDAGKDWGQEEKGETEKEMLDGITDSVDMSLSKAWEILKDRKPGVLQSMGSQRVGQLSKWTIPTVYGDKSACRSHPPSPPTISTVSVLYFKLLLLFVWDPSLAAWFSSLFCEDLYHFSGFKVAERASPPSLSKALTCL